MPRQMNTPATTISGDSLPSFNSPAIIRQNVEVEVEGVHVDFVMQLVMIVLLVRPTTLSEP